MRSIAIKILSICARAVLRKYQPKIVAITGTVGKSSAKEAIFSALNNSLVARASSGNYNTQIGVPLSVLDLPAPGKSIFRWTKVFLRTARLLLKTDHTYPDVLVLEMGADKPGDIAELTAIARPNIAVVTAITPVHLEKYGTFLAVQKEKTSIWASMGKNGIIVGNIDDSRVLESMKGLKLRKVTYGFSDEAEIRAGEKTIFQGQGEEIEEKVKGVAFKLYTNGSALPVHLKGVAGNAHISAAMAGAAVGAAMGLNYHEIVEGLHGYKSLPGRMRLVPGIKHTLILDDSYNSSPTAAESALNELAEIPVGEGNKRYAILGDMLELGAESAEYHREIGALAAELQIDALIAVGKMSEEIALGAAEGGMSREAIFNFGGAEEAGLFAQGRIKRGDVILIKGSRGMHMERVVKELMASPERAEELLVH